MRLSKGDETLEIGLRLEDVRKNLGYSQRMMANLMSSMLLRGRRKKTARHLHLCFLLTAEETEIIS